MKRLIWIVAALVLMTGGGWAATATPAPRYRVATAVVGDVAQTVTVTGTVDHVNRADVAFGTDGTLASLAVAPGTAVTAGQALGTLDTASLEAAVTRASAAVTAAEAAQAEDEAAQEEAAGASDELAAARSAATQAMTAATSAFEAQAAACADPASAACTEAVAATRSAQEAVQQAQSALQAAMDKSASTVPDSPNAATSVAEASAELVEAQQALAGARIVSPITGTVGAVSAAEGTAVTAGTPVVTVIGEGAAEVSATVPVEQLEKLAVGQEATVTPVGTTAAVAGTVSAVGTLPSASSDELTYPVTITVPSPPPSMAAGSTSTATITVATARSVLTVPTSAVRQGVVTVLTGEETTPTPVTIGAVGATRTEIREGLSEGEVVVLADLDTPVPTNDQQPGGFMGGGGGGPVRMMRPNG